MSDAAAPRLSMWTVYDHPSDHPDKFVAVRWAITAGGIERTDDVVCDPELDELRTMLMRSGLTQLARSPEDDPVIVETWV